MSLASVASEARRGQEYVRSGRAGKFTDSVSVLQQASEAYANAFSALPHELEENASPVEKTKYDNVKGAVNDLRNELVAYARKTADDLVFSSAKRAAELAKLVRQEQHGKKLAGIPYAKRPSATYAGSAIEKGKTYVSESLGRLEVIKDVLYDAKLFKPAEKLYGQGRQQTERRV